MDRIEYRDVTDKTAWGEGPWSAEPDKIQWPDDATGLPCLMVRGPHGGWCGYVGVGKAHPWHSKGYSEGGALPCTDDCSDDWHRCAVESAIEVHGGLTFSGGCGHGADPATGICHIPGKGEPDDVWWFGFDCAHCDDLIPAYAFRYAGACGTYREQPYVEAQVRNLARQLAAVMAESTAA